MSEVKALLLTDVVDSTKLSEKLGDAAMAEVWAAHDRAARDLLPAWHGREIDKTDGMLMLFDSATDAVNYAREYHHALAALPVPLKARAGIHVGPVILRENSAEDIARGAKPLEVDGLAKPAAARVMSLARGGQILLTEEARAALGETPLHLESHGYWVMKGLAQPVELFEIGDEQTRFEAPPDSEKVYRVVRVGERWLPVAKLPNNLPQQATSFVGRERELDEVKALLGTARLITLLGMGGLGKTRLSLQVAAEVMPQYPDGAWFIDLTPIRDAAFVVGEAARVLEVSEEPGRPLLQTLCARLKARRLLIILDNCEHLIEAAAELVAAVLRAAPQVRVIASSRETLRVPGEHAYPILPLPLPSRADGAETLAGFTAVRLFVERARAQKPTFELTEREAPAVAELVERLEGIPLALELAAARVRLLSVADINVRLKDRFKLLTGGDRTLQKRQQTLRALVDWSYDLLNDSEKCVLDRLSVFVGGFDLAAAEAVCGADPVEAFDVLDLIGALVEKSLVMAEEKDDGPRYRMLETIREYALEKLIAQGDESDTAARHCLHYAELARQGAHGLEGAEQPRWLRWFETERDNLRAAKSTAVAGGVDQVIAAKIATNMLGFWELRGYATEGRAVVREVLALPAVQASDLAHAWVLYAGALLAGNQGDHGEAIRLLETCLELRRKLGNPVQIGATLHSLAHYRLHCGDTAGATESEKEAIELFRAQDYRAGEVAGLTHMGQIAMYDGVDELARVEYEQALKLSREINLAEAEGECELMLGQLAWYDGNLDQCAAHCERSLAVCRGAEDRRGEARALQWLGKIAVGAGRLDEARKRLQDALRAFASFEMQGETLACLEDCASLAAACGDQDLAVAIAAAATEARQRRALQRTPREEQQFREWLERMRSEAGAGKFETAWQGGLAYETDEAVRVALLTAKRDPELAPGS